VQEALSRGAGRALQVTSALPAPFLRFQPAHRAESAALEALSSSPPVCYTGGQMSGTVSWLPGDEFEAARLRSAKVK